jgi:hypothetical protein
MNNMVFTVVAVVGQFGVTVLLAASLLAAFLGIAAFVWAMILVWQEHNPSVEPPKRRTTFTSDDRDGDSDREVAEAEGPAKKIVAWSHR